MIGRKLSAPVKSAPVKSNDEWRRRTGFTAALGASLCVLIGALAARAEQLPPIDPDTTAADFDAIEPYLGHWRSAPKTAQDGRNFHFEYRMAYLDAGETIIHFSIHMNFEDGERRLLWDGYKGWNPLDNETYYHGFSPLGRVSWGKFRQIGDEFVTFYEAFDGNGQHIHIRDIFAPIQDGKFSNVSYIRVGDQQDWRVVARDEWTRMTD